MVNYRFLLKGHWGYSWQQKGSNLCVWNVATLYLQVDCTAMGPHMLLVILWCIGLTWSTWVMHLRSSYNEKGLEMIIFEVWSHPLQELHKFLNLWIALTGLVRSNFTTLREEILAARFLLQKKLSGIEDPKIASFAEETFVSWSWKTCFAEKIFANEGHKKIFQKKLTFQKSEDIPVWLRMEKHGGIAMIKQWCE